MNTFDVWVAKMLPAMALIGAIWLVAYYNKRVTENDEPSETDELE